MWMITAFIIRVNGRRGRAQGVVNGDLIKSAVDATRRNGQLLEMKSLSTYTSGAASRTLDQLGRNLLILQQQNRLAQANLAYIFRAKFDAMFRDRMLKKAREVLAPRNRGFFTEANIIFRGKDVPFQERP
jgi:hypothetical protein